MPSLLSINEIAAVETHPLRHAILRPQQTLADCVFPGDDGVGTFHFGGFLDGRLVVIASVMKEREQRFQEFAAMKQFRLRGMATALDEQGKGFGSAVLDACVERCWAEGGEIFWCNARTSAANFYQKRGFSTLPETFEIPAIGPHQVMFLDRE
ncbi:GNAT family N-acetyltransferase [bacterium]|nr:GNAT family N-acetyltransferase [bacterium]